MKKLRAVAAMALSIAAAIAASGSVVSCGGGGAEGGCPETASCGNGSPTGTWQVRGKCAYSPVQPTQPLLYQQYTAKPPHAVLTPVQPIATTGGDWCAGLFYPAPGGTMSGIQNVTLWHDSATLESGSVQISADSTYKTSLVFQAPSVTHFTPACLQVSGFSPTCQQLETDLVKFYAAASGQKFVNPIGANGQPVSGDPIQCGAATDGGCDCRSTFEVDLIDQGTWTAAGGVLSENSEIYTYNGLMVYEDQPTVATAANYCVNGNLTLTGLNGTSLSGVLGLRTMILSKSSP